MNWVKNKYIATVILISILFVIGFIIYISLKEKEDTGVDTTTTNVDTSIDLRKSTLEEKIAVSTNIRTRIENTPSSFPYDRIPTIENALARELRKVYGNNSLSATVRTEQDEQTPGLYTFIVDIPEKKVAYTIIYNYSSNSASVICSKEKLQPSKPSKCIISEGIDGYYYPEG